MRGSFSPADKLGLTGPAGAFQEVTVALELRSPAPAERVRVIRAQASIDRDCHMVGRVGRFRLESDEPVARGGGDTAPTPLQYLLFGAAT